MTRPRCRVGVLFSCLWLILQSTNQRCFSKPRQEPSSIVRERSGQALQAKADGPRSQFDLDVADKALVKKLSSAGESRDWQTVQSSIATYNGTAVPVYTAALHAAFRCRKYKEGASIFDKCQDACTGLDGPVFSAALRLFGKLGDYERVRRIWNETLAACQLNKVLASARICAAADEGDVEAAASVLDLMVSQGVTIEVYHMSAAIRACWGFGKNQHQAAKYFFELFPKYRLKPNLVAFTTLTGALSTAPLEDLLSIYDEMTELKIPPDTIFAETFVTSLFQKGSNVDWPRTSGPLADVLREQPTDRRKAARHALQKFRSQDIKLTRLSENIEKALHSISE